MLLDPWGLCEESPYEIRNGFGHINQYIADLEKDWGNRCIWLNICEFYDWSTRGGRELKHLRNTNVRFELLFRDGPQGQPFRVDEFGNYAPAYALR